MTYHCEICNDTGWIDCEQDGYKYVKLCACQKIRINLEYAKKSGLGELLNIYTFERFKTDYAFQKDLKTKAQNFLHENNKWFTVLGKTGAGKTMICVAICKEFLNQGKSVRFMNWIEESRKLKSLINTEEYEDIIYSFKNADVLYIDDFFKSDNTTPPTPADIKLAYEIIGYRYNKSLSKGGYQTIISSERTLDQLVNYDEAITGRIVELSDGYITNLKDAINYRLKQFI